jgi:hypothetical protein
LFEGSDVHPRQEAGRHIKRIVVAYEAGRDGFWLARWLRARGVEDYIIHPASIAVSREHRRAKTDRCWIAAGLRISRGRAKSSHVNCDLVADGVVSAADVDTALCWGPGLRWGVMGNMMLNHLGGGPGGIEYFFQQFTGPMAAWWKTLGSPVLTRAKEAHRQRPCRGWITFHRRIGGRAR